MYPSSITNNTITVLLPSGLRVADKSHLNFDKIREAIRAQKFDLLEDLFDIPKAFVRWTNGMYRITDDGVYRNNERIPEGLERRIVEFMEAGLPFEPLLNFHNKLIANPSRRAVHELFKFLENRNIPIGPDGCFYGYKSVRLDWMDIYSGKFSNHIGAELSMPRNEVDDDCNRTCSYGFHVGALEYVRDFGGARENKRIVIVKVDPADVVSVPIDYNGQKMRVCRYTVHSEYTGPLPETLFDYTPPEEEPEEFIEEEEEEAETPPNTCTNCGYYPTEEDWQFCPECGSTL